ncbi:MAG: hypothetical protein ACOC0C_01135 [Bacteroidota bacterium]
MKNLIKLLMLNALIALVSCSPKVTSTLHHRYNPIDYKQEIVVINLDESAPEDAVTMGEVKVGDSGFTTNCTYSIVVNEAKMAARKAGGNAIKITEHRPPSSMGSSCHRIKAKILRVENLQALQEYEEEELLDIDYAILYVYRPGSYGFLVNYDLFLDDSIICRVTSNFREKIKIHKNGYHTLWAKTESKTEVPVNIQPGKEYYVRCGLSMGLLVGRPTLELIDKSVAKSEYLSVKAKGTKKDQIVRTNGEVIECIILNEDNATVYFSMEHEGSKIETQLDKNKIKKINYAIDNY